MGMNVTKTGKYGSLSQTSIATAGTTVLDGPILTLNMDKIYVEIDNEDASNIFDGFQIDISTDNSNWQTIYNVAADFTTPSGLLVGASGNLTALAASTTGWFILDCSGLSYIRIQASADTAAINASGRWSAL